MKPIIYLKSLTLFPVLALAQSCYYPNGDLSTTDGPCSSSDGSMCCPLNWECMDNGLCYLGNADYISRYTCTDSSWSASGCPNFCTESTTSTNGTDAGAEAIMQCADGSYCCNGNRSGNCCEDSDADLFDLPDGAIFASISSLGSPASDPEPTDPVREPSDTSPVISDSGPSPTPVISDSQPPDPTTTTEPAPVVSSPSRASTPSPTSEDGDDPTNDPPSPNPTVTTSPRTTFAGGPSPSNDGDSSPTADSSSSDDVFAGDITNTSGPFILTSYYPESTLPNGVEAKSTLITQVSTNSAGQATTVIIVRPGPTPDSSSGGSDGPNTGAIAGGVVGGVVAIAVIVAILLFLRRRRRNNDSPPPSPRLQPSLPQVDEKRVSELSGTPVPTTPSTINAIPVWNTPTRPQQQRDFAAVAPSRRNQGPNYGNAAEMEAPRQGQAYELPTAYSQQAQGYGQMNPYEGEMHAPGMGAHDAEYVTRPSGRRPSERPGIAR